MNTEYIQLIGSFKKELYAQTKSAVDNANWILHELHQEFKLAECWECKQVDYEKNLYWNGASYHPTSNHKCRSRESIFWI